MPLYIYMSININSNVPTQQTMDVQQTSAAEKPQNNSGVQPNPKPTTSITDRNIGAGMGNAHLIDKMQNRHITFHDRQADNKAIRDARIANANGDKKEIRQAKKDYRKQSLKNAGESIKHFFRLGRADKAKRSQKQYENMMKQQENPTPAAPKSREEILAKMQQFGHKSM